jgi:hypothetical protein
MNAVTAGTAVDVANSALRPGDGSATVGEVDDDNGLSPLRTAMPAYEPDGRGQSIHGDPDLRWSPACSARS